MACCLTLLSLWRVTGHPVLSSMSTKLCQLWGKSLVPCTVWLCKSFTSTAWCLCLCDLQQLNVSCGMNDCLLSISKPPATFHLHLIWQHLPCSISLTSLAPCHLFPYFYAFITKLVAPALKILCICWSKFQPVFWIWGICVFVLPYPIGWLPPCFIHSCLLRIFPFLFYVFLMKILTCNKGASDWVKI